jgi:hypothetical protein
MLAVALGIGEAQFGEEPIDAVEDAVGHGEAEGIGWDWAATAPAEKPATIVATSARLNCKIFIRGSYPPLLQPTLRKRSV